MQSLCNTTLAFQVPSRIQFAAKDACINFGSPKQAIFGYKKCLLRPWGKRYKLPNL
jgi:hypothetical protein